MADTSSSGQTTVLRSGQPQAFPGMVEVTADGFAIPPHGRPLTRMVARAFDAYDQSKAQHSAAI